MSRGKGSAKIVRLDAEGPRWSANDVKRLKEFVSQKLSYRQIARRLKRTRNQVIGKVHRLGIREAATPERVSADNSLMLRIASVQRQRYISPDASRVVTSRAWAPDATVSITDLGEGACKWPVGDPKEPGFGFCGCARVSGRPYCATHTAVAYVITPEEGDVVDVPIAA